jgi:hypothetical protein
LILERFGRFWGAFSVIDLFLLNALTIVTEFIGISLASASSASRSRSACHCGGSDHRRGGHRQFPSFRAVLNASRRRQPLLVPVFLMVHPPVAQMVGDFLVQGCPRAALPARSCC